MPNLVTAYWYSPPRFSEIHGFEKPNDVRALNLMDRAAKSVMDEYEDVVLAFGESDEYRWISSIMSHVLSWNTC